MRRKGRVPLTPEELAKLVDGYRTDADDAHARLRADFRILHEQTDMSLMLMRDGQTALRGRVDLIERTPPDVGKLRFSTSVVVSIVIVTVSLVGGGYGLSNRVLNRIDAFQARMDRQAAEDKTERASAAKTSEERYLRSERQFEAFGRQMELMKYEQQRLREDVTKKNGSTR